MNVFWVLTETGCCFLYFSFAGGETSCKAHTRAQCLACYPNGGAWTLLPCILYRKHRRPGRGVEPGWLNRGRGRDGKVWTYGWDRINSRRLICLERSVTTTTVLHGAACVAHSRRVTKVGTVSNVDVKCCSQLRTVVVEGGGGQCCIPLIRLFHTHTHPQCLILFQSIHFLTAGWLVCSIASLSGFVTYILLEITHFCSLGSKWKFKAYLDRRELLQA